MRLFPLDVRNYSRPAVVCRVLALLSMLLWPAVSLRAQATQSAATKTGTLLADTPFATPYYIYDSGRPGPVVMITGGVHGNEPAGSAAADEIRHWRVGRGKLIVMPKLNIRGLAARKRTVPGVESALADLNRNFAQVADKNEKPRGRLATAIWQFVSRQKPDWLIDLHEAQSLHGTLPGSVGNLLLICPSEEMTAARPEMLRAVNATISDPRYRFAVGRAPKDTTLARAAGVHLGIHSMIIETAQPGQKLEIRVAEHCTIVKALFVYLKMEPQSVGPASRAGR